MRRMNYRHAGIIALFFGVFQALMPAIGWFLGKQFESYITSVDHWIAFILLGFIGVNMVHEALGEDEDLEEIPQEHLDLKELFMLAIATSIDALAVGITFAFLQVKNHSRCLSDRQHYIYHFLCRSWYRSSVWSPL